MNLVSFLIYILVFFWGAVLGSFANVIIWRWPKSLSIIFPGSHCPYCGTLIRWWENIPVLSFLILSGQCRYCRAPISFRYLFVEIITGFISVAIFKITIFPNLSFFPYIKEGIIYFLYYFLLSWILLVILFIDLKEMVIPDFFVWSGVIIGLLGSLFFNIVDPLESVIGIVVGYLLIWLPFIVIYSYIKGYPGMGLGDAKLMAMIGTFYGWRGVIFVLVGASLQGLFIAVLLYLVERMAQKLKKEEPFLKRKLPFAPFIAITSWEFLFWGRWFLDFYLQ